MSKINNTLYSVATRDKGSTRGQRIYKGAKIMPIILITLYDYYIIIMFHINLIKQHLIAYVTACAIFKFDPFVILPILPSKGETLAIPVWSGLVFSGQFLYMSFVDCDLIIKRLKNVSHAASESTVAPPNQESESNVAPYRSN